MACYGGDYHRFLMEGYTPDGKWEIWVCTECAHKMWKRAYG